MLSQSRWVWPAFAFFPALFIGYYAYTLTHTWIESLRWVSAILIFALTLVAAILLLRRYCRYMELDYFRRRRCPQCQHTQWDYREARGGKTL